jgi:DNA-binding IclR family transcriptional regulator
MDVCMGFWPSKTLLSAVELDLFSHLGGESMTGDEVGKRLGLHARATYDFLDALVALRFLERDGDGADGRYRNSAEAAAFLDEKSPAYIGGFLKMCNARLYRFWDELTEALKTGATVHDHRVTLSVHQPICAHNVVCDNEIGRVPGCYPAACHDINL